jgi:hypothetical protein
MMMKERNEEHIEQLIAQQLGEDGNTGTDILKDSALYRELLVSLADEPADFININLADPVIAHIKLKQEKAESIRFWLAIAGVLIAGIVATCFAVNYLSPPTLISAFNFIDVYKWLFIFAVFCFALIQVADKNLVKRKLAG